MRAAIFAIIAGCLPLGAYAHQSFSATDPGGLTRVTAPIEAATFDGQIWMTTPDGQRVLVALGIPSAMMKKGLPMSDLAVGKTVTVDAYAGSDADRMFARRIMIDGRVIDLRA